MPAPADDGTENAFTPPLSPNVKKNITPASGQSENGDGWYTG